MRAEDRGRWAAAMARGRKRWNSGRPAERVRVQDELDALWAELQALDTEPSPEQSPVGPRHAALGALLASFEWPGAGVTSRVPDEKVSPPRVRSA